MKLYKLIILIGFMLIAFSYNMINSYALENTTVYTSPSMSTSGKVIWLDLTTPKEQSLGVVQSTASYGFRFFINKSTQIGEIYKIQINFNDYDYLHGNTANYWHIVGYNGTSVAGDCNLIGFEMKNQGGNSQMKTVIVMYQCPTVNSGVMFYNEDDSGDNLTRISTINWRINSIQWEHITDTSTSDIINNNTNNTNNIINNNNNNTQTIIDNQNEIAEQQHNDQLVCEDIDKNDIKTDNKYLGSNGTEYSSNNYGITDYIDLENRQLSISTKFNYSTSFNIYACYYTSNKSLISCQNIGMLETLTIPSNAKYFRSSIYKVDNQPIYNYCKNGNQAITDTLNDDNVGGATGEAGDFITGFDTNTFGLTAIVTAPLNLIESLTSKSCSQLELPLPFLDNKKLILPCMTTIYQNTFGSLFTMYQTITFGIIAYWVCVRIFNMVKDFKNPDHDEVEVVEL